VALSALLVSCNGLHHLTCQHLQHFSNLKPACVHSVLCEKPAEACWGSCVTRRSADCSISSLLTLLVQQLQPHTSNKAKCGHTARCQQQQRITLPGPCRCICAHSVPLSLSRAACHVCCCCFRLGASAGSPAGAADWAMGSTLLKPGTQPVWRQTSSSSSSRPGSHHAAADWPCGHGPAAGSCWRG
jgi:hypothetical protein